MSYLQIALCAAIGFGAWQVLTWLWGYVVEQIPPQRQQWWYSTIKDLPGTLFSLAIVIAFLAALGATVIHYAAFPRFASEIKEATSWGPGTLGGMLVLGIYAFWCSPDTPPPQRSRGRSLKRPEKLTTAASQPGKRESTAPRRRGRTIRTYRDTPR